MFINGVERYEYRLSNKADASYVHSLVGKTVGGSTGNFTYRLVSFDGSKGIIEMIRDGKPDVAHTILSIPIYLSDLL